MFQTTFTKMELGKVGGIFKETFDTIALISSLLLVIVVTLLVSVNREELIKTDSIRIIAVLGGTADEWQTPSVRLVGTGLVSFYLSWMLIIVCVLGSFLANITKNLKTKTMRVEYCLLIFISILWIASMVIFVHLFYYVSGCLQTIVDVKFPNYSGEITWTQGGSGYISRKSNIWNAVNEAGVVDQGSNLITNTTMDKGIYSLQWEGHLMNVLYSICISATAGFVFTFIGLICFALLINEFCNKFWKQNQKGNNEQVQPSLM